MLHLLHDEANKIIDPELKHQVLKAIDGAPVDSWKKASARDHHVRDECGEWGNLIHTVRVVRICNTLADILELPPRAKDILRSAALLHDSCKHGVRAEARFIYREHPQLVKQLVSKIGVDLFPDVIDAIEQHMGRWGTVQCDWTAENKITIPFLLHAADCIEARLTDMTIPKTTSQNSDNQNGTSRLL